MNTTNALPGHRQASRMLLYTVVLFLLYGLLPGTLVPPAEAILINNGLTHVYAVVPGGTYDGELLIANPDTSDVTLLLYLSDYLFDAEDTIEYGDPGSHARSNAPWITIGAERVTVPAGTERAVPFRISVPDDPSLTGTYWSLIMVEPLPPEEFQEVDNFEEVTDPTFIIRTIVRYGIQIITDISGTGEPALQLSGARLALEPEGDGPTFVVDVANLGTQWINPDTWLELYDLQGTQLAIIPGDGGRIFPNTSVRQRFFLPPLESGDYLALLVIDGGGQHVFAARYTLRIETEE
ncbi:MAG: hypothetical protein BAA04_13035 [Firmicutes bacterium ZCTH02-B6]|nr:MAG: hypothetical protein BAA04_13035 [Firmicutes bacterium ZCTH02-B6]